MKGLPHTTEISKQLPKAAIYRKFDVAPAQQAHFDADVSKMMFANIISANTLPAIKEGKTVQGIFVLDIQLKRRDYDPKNITMLSRLIPQKMVFVLQYGGCAQLAIYHDKLHCGEWMNADEIGLPLEGLTLDEVWDNIVKSIGNITIDGKRTLSEQIAEDDRQRKIICQIESLERKARAERQPRRKIELFNMIQNLKTQI